MNISFEILELLVETSVFFFEHFSVIDRFLYEMIENFYVILDKLPEKYLAASLRVYFLKKTF